MIQAGVAILVYSAVSMVLQGFGVDFRLFMLIDGLDPAHPVKVRITVVIIGLILCVLGHQRGE